MTRNTKTSQPSRYKLFHNGEDNCWYVHDHKYGDDIQLFACRGISKRCCEQLNAGSGFGEDRVPNFFLKNA